MKGNEKAPFNEMRQTVRLALRKKLEGNSKLHLCDEFRLCWSPDV